MKERGKTAEAGALLADLGAAQPTTDHDAGILAITVKDRTASLTEAVRRLDTAGLAIADIALRRPTLDEVFLTLTSRE
jgi:ABC-2 type transport system ATP-binding protein